MNSEVQNPTKLELTIEFFKTVNHKIIVKILQNNNIPAYSVTSLHLEHSVAWGAENVLTEHILQLQNKYNTSISKKKKHKLFKNLTVHYYR